MTPERWQQIETLYHTALERVPEDCTAFLAEACAAAAGLRHEVEAMLRSAPVFLVVPTEIACIS